MSNEQVAPETNGVTVKLLKGATKGPGSDLCLLFHITTHNNATLAPFHFFSLFWSRSEPSSSSRRRTWMKRSGLHGSILERIWAA